MIKSQEAEQVDCGTNKEPRVKITRIFHLIRIGQKTDCFLVRPRLFVELDLRANLFDTKSIVKLNNKIMYVHKLHVYLYNNRSLTICSK